MPKANKKRHEILLWLLAPLLILCGNLPLPDSASSEEPTSHCKTEVRVDENDPLRYRLRGDRCEGRYAFRGFSGSQLGVVGLQRIMLDNRTEQVNPLALVWHGPTREAVALRAVSLREGVYYRLDSKRPADQHSYVWPTGLLASLKLRPAHLGITATCKMPVNGELREVHLPVTARPCAPPLPK